MSNIRENDTKQARMSSELSDNKSLGIQGCVVLKSHHTHTNMENVSGVGVKENASISEPSSPSAETV